MLRDCQIDDRNKIVADIFKDIANPDIKEIAIVSEKVKEIIDTKTESLERIYRCKVCKVPLKGHICLAKNIPPEKLKPKLRRQLPNLFGVKRRNRVKPRGKYEDGTVKQYKCTKCNCLKGKKHKCSFTV